MYPNAPFAGSIPRRPKQSDGTKPVVDISTAAIGDIVIGADGVSQWKVAHRNNVKYWRIVRATTRTKTSVGEKKHTAATTNGQLRSAHPFASSSSSSSSSSEPFLNNVIGGNTVSQSGGPRGAIARRRKPKQPRSNDKDSRFRPMVIEDVDWVTGSYAFCWRPFGPALSQPPQQQQQQQQQLLVTQQQWPPQQTPSFMFNNRSGLGLYTQPSAIAQSAQTQQSGKNLLREEKI